MSNTSNAEYFPIYSKNRKKNCFNSMRMGVELYCRLRFDSEKKQRITIKLNNDIQKVIIKGVANDEP